MDLPKYNLISCCANFESTLSRTAIQAKYLLKKQQQSLINSPLKFFFQKVMLSNVLDIYQMIVKLISLPQVKYMFTEAQKLTQTSYIKNVGQCFRTKGNPFISLYCGSHHKIKVWFYHLFYSFVFF